MSAPTLLTYGPSNIDETLTLAWSHMIPGIKDNVFSENTALGWFYKTGKESLKGGASISHGLMYGGNSGAGSYARYEQLNTTPVDGLTRDQWAWKQYHVPVSIDGFTERTAGGGSDQVLADALQTKKNQSQLAIKNLLETDLFKASASIGTNDLRSLPVIVLGSGTEGQVNGSTNSWWVSTVTAAGSWAAGVGRTKLVNTINTLSKKAPAGLPTLLLSDQDSIEAYEGTTISQYRFDSDKPDLGMNPKLTFKGIPWLWSVQGTSGVIYILHDEAIKFYVDKNTDFLTTPFVTPTNQDAKVSHILITCALACCYRRKLGKTTSNAA
jgi:hypothetical protein